MGSDGHYQFSDERLADVQKVGKEQIRECNEIWENVMNRIEALYPDGQIDAGLAAVLAERNEQYVKDVRKYGDDLDMQNFAVSSTRDIAQEGGQAMRRAAGR